MRLTFIFLIAACLQANAKGYAQRVTLNERNTPLGAVLQKIKKQSNLHIVYREEWIENAPGVSVHLTNVPLQEALDSCFKEQPVTYELVDRTLVLKKRERATDHVMDASPPITITGKVIGSDGLPLADVSIMIKGTSTGVTTGPDGSFRISVPDEKAVLLFSYVGFESQEVPVRGKRNMEVKLSPAGRIAEDVVVVAYGTQKKVTVTGAVSSVTSDQLMQSSSASLDNALAGRLSGLTSIQSGGGQPGRDDATMYLRGAATTNGTNPLILIDGVPRDNIRTLDAGEVASVTVLKDASSTAVFGVRGANGVILITTRRGAEGKTRLNANVIQSFSSFTREPERLHSVDYMKLRNEASANDGINPLPFSQADMDKYANPLLGLDPNDPDHAAKARLRRYMYPDHDYYREYIAQYTPQTRVSLSASGGSNKITYFVNGVYLHQGGNLKTEPQSVLGYDPSSWMDRYNFRSNLDFKISSSLKSFLNIGSYIEKVNMPAAWLYGGDTHWMMRDLIYQAQTILPITPGPTTLEGFGVAPGQIVDPGYMDRSAFEIINRMGYRNEVRSNLNSSLGLEWDLSRTVTKGLSLKGMISYDSRATTAMQGNKSERLYLAAVNSSTDQLSYAVKRSNESLLNLIKGTDSRYNINIQGSINYNRVFGKHAVSSMALAQRDNWESTVGEIPFNVVGLAGRFTYAYDNRYLAEVNLGYNGSEQFAPTNRFGFFPAVSAGWVVSNEKFFRQASNTVTNLKLRASYGKVGNDQIGGARFLYLDNITMGGGPLSSLGLGQAINQGLLGNPNLSWEVAEKQNTGIDLGFFNELTFSFDYFTEHRSKILISRGTVPEFQGVPLSNIPKVNMGKVDNKGYEIELTYNKAFSRDFSLMVKGNYSYNHNIVISIDEPMRDAAYAYRYRNTGYSLGQNWGYKIDYSNGNGYFNSQAELDDYLSKTQYGFGTPRVGDFKYLNINHDNIIDDKDIAPIKYTTIPGINFGFMFSLHYKKFELTPFFQGVARYSGNYSWQGVYENVIKGTYFGYHRTAWTAERYAKGEKITYPALSTHTTTNHTANDFFIMDRSFIRLKNIELAYTLPAGSLKKLGVQSLRVYASAQNLITWDKLRMKHLDPENDDSLGYPVTKTTNFGVNVTF
ncbi:MAG: TonB-dependent receptor [Chitinophagaceae bacterium]|nr:TonB-dependent receptor [Chitinophagaceae bacterium]